MPEELTAQEQALATVRMVREVLRAHGFRFQALAPLSRALGGDASYMAEQAFILENKLDQVEEFLKPG